MKYAATLLLALVVAGCGARPDSTGPTSNAEIPVDTMFTKDGCTVYRFVVHGTHHYFSRCVGAEQSLVQERVSCGKNCSRLQSMPTN